MSDNLSLTCVEISLFGSRVNLKSKGGDIDLFLKFSSEKDIDSLHLKRKLKIALKDKLGDQKIDIIIDDSNTDLGAIGKVISRDKVALWLKK
jgi:predicted nucleotidyltransferase